MNENLHVKNFSDFELICMYNSIKNHLNKNSDKELHHLKNLFMLLEVEIHNRELSKE